MAMLRMSGEEAPLETLPPDPKVAVKIAQCVVAAKEAPALKAQLRLLRIQPTTSGQMIPQRRELKQMLPELIRTTQELAERGVKDETKALPELLGMLQTAYQDREDGGLSLPEAIPSKQDEQASLPGD